MDKVAVVAHDAGGSEIISSYLKHKDFSCRYVLRGPAKNIFKRKLGVLSSLDLSEAINDSDWLLCGTSWQSDLERKAIRLAKEKKKPIKVFLEHWGNYLKRFIHDGVLLLPDEVIVGDEYAEELAKSCLPKVLVTRVENPYLEEMLEKIEARQSTSKTDGARVLYVCEPVREPCLIQYGNPLYKGYTEEDALSYFLDHVSRLNKEIESIVIRAHPSEPTGKYLWAKKKYPHLPITTSCHELFYDLSKSDVVVGCETMAMVVALMAGKEVFSAIPPGGGSCQLPHKGIQLFNP